MGPVLARISIQIARQSKAKVLAQKPIYSMRRIPGGGHHHHSHGQDSSGAQQNPIAQLFSKLGQALQSGNLTAAQQAYTTLQQDFQSTSGSASSSTPSSSSVQTVA
jgi:hypothetical protein